MTVTYARLAEITEITATAGAVITNASSTTTYIRLIIIHNANGTSETVELWNVPDNAGAVGTAANANKMHKETLAAGSTRILEYPAPGIVLTDTNDTIQAKADTATGVTFQAYGGTE